MRLCIMGLCTKFARYALAQKAHSLATSIEYKQLFQESDS